MERSWDGSRSHSPGTEGALKALSAAASAHALLQLHLGDPGPTSPRCCRTRVVVAGQRAGPGIPALLLHAEGELLGRSWG